MHTLSNTTFIQHLQKFMKTNEHFHFGITTYFLLENEEYVFSNLQTVPLALWGSAVMFGGERTFLRPCGLKEEQSFPLSDC